MSHKLLSNKNQIIKQINTSIQITKENRLYIYQMVDNIAMTPIHIKTQSINLLELRITSNSCMINNVVDREVSKIELPARN